MKSSVTALDIHGDDLDEMGGSTVVVFFDRILYSPGCIKSRVDALANLPGPGKVAPERGCGR